MFAIKTHLNFIFLSDEDLKYGVQCTEAGNWWVTLISYSRVISFHDPLRIGPTGVNDDAANAEGNDIRPNFKFTFVT